GTPFPELLASKGVIPGIKVDKGAKPLANAPGETITEGLDGLRERFEEYVSLGARAGGRPRADRRARGADGRHALDRGGLPRDGARAARGLHRAARPAGRA